MPHLLWLQNLLPVFLLNMWPSDIIDINPKLNLSKPAFPRQGIPRRNKRKSYKGGGLYATDSWAIGRTEGHQVSRVQKILSTGIKSQDKEGGLPFLLEYEAFSIRTWKSNPTTLDTHHLNPHQVAGAKIWVYSLCHDFPYLQLHTGHWNASTKYQLLDLSNCSSLLRPFWLLIIPLCPDFSKYW